MPKVVYTADKGLVQEQGSGIVFESGPLSTVQAKAATGVITAPGVYTLSGSAAITMTMPLANDVPGGVFVFRAASVHTHALTGLSELFMELSFKMTSDESILTLAGHY